MSLAVLNPSELAAKEATMLTYFELQSLICQEIAQSKQREWNILWDHAMKPRKGTGEFEEIRGCRDTTAYTAIDKFPD